MKNKKRKKQKTLRDLLEQLEIRKELVEEIKQIRASFSVEETQKNRIPMPDTIYYGREIWDQAVSALLCGKNLLLVGHKATGKNIFAENLAGVFQRPKWDISFHVATDAASLIGMDTFKNGEVQFRPGPIYNAAKYGGFAILDEINMAKSEAMAVLHSTLDFRRCIDVPGYERMKLHPATRLIATMNYGYFGTKELNEALVSRFVVIKMPMISTGNLVKLILDQYPAMRKKMAVEFAEIFLELQKKCEHGELSSKALDLRGLLDAIALMEKGVSVYTALDMGITNKTFDEYEQTLIRDTIRARISRKVERKDIF